MTASDASSQRIKESQKIVRRKGVDKIISANALAGTVKIDFWTPKERPKFYDQEKARKNGMERDELANALKILGYNVETRPTSFEITIKW